MYTGHHSRPDQHWKKFPDSHNRCFCDPSWNQGSNALCRPKRMTSPPPVSREGGVLGVAMPSPETETQSVFQHSWFDRKELRQGIGQCPEPPGGVAQASFLLLAS